MRELEKKNGHYNYNLKLLQVGLLLHLKHVTVYILYNYCIHDLRDEGVNIYIYRYSINQIIQLYR